MPFTDPMADGPAIQAAGVRALKGGQRMTKTLAMVREFRKTDDATPIVLMGYYNPIYIYGVDKFLADAKQAGVDGLIVVDLPPEEDEELCLPALKAGLTHTGTRYGTGCTWIDYDRDGRLDLFVAHYTPIYIYGVDKFLADAKSAGVDGLIVVDLPPEEDE